MYPPSFDYIRAGTVEEAISRLGEGGSLLAGGHSLLPVMKMRLADPGTLIDIGRIDELKGIGRNDESFTIGALTTHTTVTAFDANGFPKAQAEAAAMIGDPQVRNRGTVGGNVAHADPASDLPTVLSALGATFNVTGPDGSRSIAGGEFFTGLFETALGEGEILTSIDVGSEGAGTGSAYAKLFNPASRYAMVAACATVELSEDGTCTSCSVAVGGLTSRATILESVGASMVGNAPTPEAIEAAAALAAEAVGDDVMSDIHASAEYRRRMLPVFVSRALNTAGTRAD